MVDGIGLHLVEYLARVRQGLGHVTENLIHLLTGLEPFLLGIEHTVGVVEVFACGEAQEVIVGLGVFLVYEVGIIGAYQFDAIFLGQLYEHPVGFLLQRKGFAVGAQVRVFHLMALQLQIIVVAEHTLIPLYGLAGTGNVVLQNLGGHLACYTG